MSNLDFGLQELFDDDDDDNWIGKGLWIFVKLVAVVVSALTTGAFFYTYAGDAFAFVAGASSPLFSAVVGALILDGFSVLWSYLRGHHADTTREMKLAQIMAYMNMGTSVVCTAIYLMLNTAFNVGVYDAFGNMTELGQWLNGGGILVMAIGICGNFIAVGVYSDESATNQEALERTKLRANVSKGRQEVKTTHTKQVVDRTKRKILEDIPVHAEETSEEQKTQYFKNKHQTAAPISKPAHQPEETTTVSSQRYYVVAVEDGKMKILPGDYTLGQAWRVADARQKVHDESEHFVVDSELEQPVDRSGNPVEVELVVEDLGNGHVPLR